MSKITCENYRRFGVEIELNTTTNVIKDKNQVPDGSHIVASIIQNVCNNDDVALNGWLYVNNNDSWIIKPDSTCGIEINSPILKGGYDLAKLCKVVEKLSEHPLIKADDRCSFHVHVNLEDLSDSQIGSVLAWWIKCESVFFDSVPLKRKCHRHAQLISASNFMTYDYDCSYKYLISMLSETKYFSANVYHMRQKRRKSVEFRIAGNEFCLNPVFVKNWVSLLLHFVNRAIVYGYPNNYDSDDSWSGLLSLSPKEVFHFLQFDSKTLSPGMAQTKQWFLQQLKRNITQGNISFWLSALRQPAISEVRFLSSKEEEDIMGDHDENTLLYSKEYFK